MPMNHCIVGGDRNGSDSGKLHVARSPKSQMLMCDAKPASSFWEMGDSISISVGDPHRNYVMMISPLLRCRRGEKAFFSAGCLLCRLLRARRILKAPGSSRRRREAPDADFGPGGFAGCCRNPTPISRQPVIAALSLVAASTPLAAATNWRGVDFIVCTR